MENRLGPESHLDPRGPDVRRSLTPDPPVFNEPLLSPAAPFLAPSEGTPTPRDSYTTNNFTNSAPLLPGVGEKGPADASAFTAKKSQPLRKKPLMWVLVAIALALVATAVVVPVYFTVIKPKNATVTGGTGGSNGGGGPSDNPTHQPPTSSTSGGNGSVIKTENGSEFTYVNPYNGICESGSEFLGPRCFLMIT